MTPTDFLLILTVLSGLLGSIAHSLSDDGAASVLEHFGTEARLPKATVYIVVLACTFGAGTADALLGGADVAHALSTAALAFTAAVFGAAKQQTAAAKVAVVLVFAGAMSACAAFAKVEPLLPSPDQIACVLVEAEAGNDMVPDVMAKCGIDALLVHDIELLLMGHKKAKAMRMARMSTDAGADAVAGCK